MQVKNIVTFETQLWHWVKVDLVSWINTAHREEGKDVFQLSSYATQSKLWLQKWVRFPLPPTNDVRTRVDWHGRKSLDDYSTGGKSASNYLDNKASNRHWTCYNGRPCFYMGLTLQTFIWLDNLVLKLKYFQINTHGNVEESKNTHTHKHENRKTVIWFKLLCIS